MIDNRIRFPGPKIDFETDVGLGQGDHNNYPAYGAQARADWMRLYLIGLLSAQSSLSEPTEYRDGTIWFDLNSLAYKIYSNNSWKEISNAIDLGGKTLQEWYDEASLILADSSPEVVFNGRCVTNGATLITIPISLRDNIKSSARCFVYINGLLIDPRQCEITAGITSVKLNSVILDTGDEFTIQIRSIPVSTFYTTDVVV